jgi:hypothetical protein
MGLSSKMNISENVIENIIESHIPADSDIKVHVKGIKIGFISNKLGMEWGWIVPLPDLIIDENYKDKLINNCVYPALLKIQEQLELNDV